MASWIAILLTFASTYMLTFAGELTFELPDNERQCFHEVIEKGVKSTIEFQVKYLINNIQFIFHNLLSK